MLYGACFLDASHMWLVLELANGGDLFRLLLSHAKPPNWDIQRNLIVQAAQAVNHLHTRPSPIIHGNIKSTKFLVQLPHHLWLNVDTIENPVGERPYTLPWAAPEVSTHIRNLSYLDFRYSKSPLSGQQKLIFIALAWCSTRLSLANILLMMNIMTPKQLSLLKPAKDHKFPIIARMNLNLSWNCAGSKTGTEDPIHRSCLEWLLNSPTLQCCVFLRARSSQTRSSNHCYVL